MLFSLPEPSGTQGELIVYPWSGIRSRPSIHNFKLLHLWNRLTNQSQISCGASLWRGNESFYKWSRSHDQDGRHASKNLLLQNRKSYDLETWQAASGTQVLQSLYKLWIWVDIDLFYGKVKFGNLGFYIKIKVKTMGFSATNAACDYTVLISQFKTCSDWQACFQMYICAVWTVYICLMVGNLIKNVCRWFKTRLRLFSC